MSYKRVIPRDLFNDANLLKCLGQVYLNLETANFPGVALEHDTDECEEFDICQHAEDGSTGVSNLTLNIGYRRFWFTRPMNSREAWPLYVVNHDEDGEEIPVFDTNGTFTHEFVQFIEQKQNEADDE